MTTAETCHPHPDPLPPWAGEGNKGSTPHKPRVAAAVPEGVSPPRFFGFAHVDMHVEGRIPFALAGRVLVFIESDPADGQGAALFELVADAREGGRVVRSE